MERTTVGSESKTDVVLCYMANRVNRKHLKILRKKLEDIKVKALPLSHESLRECLIPEQMWNPFPKIRYTERPDAAAACVYDGNIIIITDGSPTIMIAPTGIFDFIQDINDYYFSPVIGSMLRFLRIGVFTLSLLFIPLWYLFVILYKENLPDTLMFMAIEEEYTVPVIVQLFIVEFVIDALRLASLNTPSALSNSFSVVAALVLGEFAVKSGWFVSEVVLFMAFVTISNFVQPSYELGYSVKIFRMLILFLTALLKGWGFVIGLILTVLVISFTKTVFGYTYLYPLIPFDGDALKKLVLRRSINFKEKNLRR
jgi:stage V sporulation protein AF